MSEAWQNLGEAAPLEGIRVLELPGDVATRYCGGLFARLGADVVQLGVCSDDSIGYGGDAGGVYGRWLDQGKTRIDSLDGVDGWTDLVVAGQHGADITHAESVVHRLEGGPSLLALTWFHSQGPYRDWVGTDETILALSGLSYAFGEREGPPILAQGHTPQLLGGAHGFIAGMAAVLEVEERGPHRIEANIFEATMCLTEIGAIAGLDNGLAASRRLGVNRFTPTYPCASYCTADGWIGVTCLTPAQWRAMCGLIGRDDLADQPTYATSYERLMHADEIDEILIPVIRSRPTADWIADGMAKRIPMAPMVTPGDLPHQEHWRHRRAFSGFSPAGALAPAGPARSRFDGHRVPRWESTAAAGPLSGLRVLDFSMGWAGPWATRTLADLGADVVKVESRRHPDWWRGWEADDGGDPPTIEVAASFNAVSRNKRGVALDLTTPEGHKTAKALIARADVVVENFAAGVLDKLGLGQNLQRRLRPGLISISMAAFGASGPLSSLRAYGSTVEQASGLPFMNGCDGWPPSLQHVAFGDPVAGVYAVTAVLTALAARDRLGGANIDLSQVACLFELSADGIIAQQISGALPRTGSRRRRRAPSCVSRTESDDDWVAVSVDSEDCWQGLCHVIGRGEWATATRLATVEGRIERADTIEQAIAAWTASLTADGAVARLQAAGVPAAPVKRPTSLGADAQLCATGFWERLERRYVGEHTLGASPFRFDGARPLARRPAPTLGEHTSEVLAELAGHDQLNGRAT